MSETDAKTSLPKAEQRFLSRALSVARSPDIRVRTHADVIRHFPPMSIMGGFKDVPARRADVLQACTGFNMRETAMSLETEVVGAILETAFKKGEIDANKICAAVPSDDFVRYHDAHKIWALLFENGWPNRNTPEHQLFMSALLEDAINEKLLDDSKTKANTWFELVKIIGYQEFMSDRIPIELRASVLELALKPGETAAVAASGAAKPAYFTAKVLLAPLNPGVLAKHLELPVLERVLKNIAYKYGWENPKPIVEEAEISLSEDGRPTNPPPSKDEPDIESGPAQDVELPPFEKTTNDEEEKTRVQLPPGAPPLPKSGAKKA